MHFQQITPRINAFVDGGFWSLPGAAVYGFIVSTLRTGLEAPPQVPEERGRGLIGPIVLFSVCYNNTAVTCRLVLAGSGWLEKPLDGRFTAKLVYLGMTASEWGWIFPGKNKWWIPYLNFASQGENKYGIFTRHNLQPRAFTWWSEFWVCIKLEDVLK